MMPPSMTSSTPGELEIQLEPLLPPAEPSTSDGATDVPRGRKVAHAYSHSVPSIVVTSPSPSPFARSKMGWLAILSVLVVVALSAASWARYDGGKASVVCPDSSTQFFLGEPIPSGGTLNQLGCLTRSMSIAWTMGRTLLLPPQLHRHESLPEFAPPYQPWSAVLDFEPITSAGLPILDLFDAQACDVLPSSKGDGNLECRGQAGVASYTPSTNQKALHAVMNWTATVLPSDWPHAGPYGTTEVGELLRDWDADQRVSCMLDVYYGTRIRRRRGTDEPDWERLLKLQAWLKGAASYLASGSGGASQTMERKPWREGLGVEDGEAAKAVLVGLAEEDAGGSYVAVHWRREDFRQFCEAAHSSDLDHCWPSISSALQVIGSAAASHPGLPVLVVSNTQDPDELAAFSAEGYVVVDHGQLATEAVFGPWAPGWIDLAILDGAPAAFVGNRYSTFSAWIAGRRTAMGSEEAVWF